MISKEKKLQFQLTAVTHRTNWYLDNFSHIELKNGVSAFFKCLKQYGYIDSVMTIDDLIDRSDYELFKKVFSPSHSLYRLLPPYRTSDLRLRGHPFQLPEYDTDSVLLASTCCNYFRFFRF